MLRLAVPLLSLIFLTSLLLPPSIEAVLLKGASNDTGVGYTLPLPPRVISQSFVASHPNLATIEVMAKSVAAQSRGLLTLTLFSATDSSLLATAAATINLGPDKAFQPLSFPVQAASRYQAYLMDISFLPDSGSNPIILNRSQFNAFQSGELETATGPGDLVFRTYYQLDGNYPSLLFKNFFQKLIQDPFFVLLYGIIIATLTIKLIALWKKYA